jgi:hypothetical protein
MHKSGWIKPALGCVGPLDRMPIEQRADHTS